VQLIVGEGARQSIKIDQIRALQRQAVLAPYSGQHRVFILRRMDQATTEAANSLLKTLEEPPSHAVLVLTAERAESLPATVISRCQRLELRPVAYRTIKDILIERGLVPAQARQLAKLSGGRIGWALQAAEEPEVLELRQQALDQLLKLLPADRVERFRFARETSPAPATARRQIELWITWWRDLLLLYSQVERHVVNVDRMDDLRAVSAETTFAQALAALATLHETVNHLDSNVNAQLALEGLLLKLPYLEPGGSPVA
jgi:DNA polymerase-3 subunit delta'